MRRLFIACAESCDVSAYALKLLTNHAPARGDVTAGYMRIDTERLRPVMEQIAGRLTALTGRATRTRGGGRGAQHHPDHSGAEARCGPVTAYSGRARAGRLPDAEDHFTIELHHALDELPLPIHERDELRVHRMGRTFQRLLRRLRSDRLLISENCLNSFVVLIQGHFPLLDVNANLSRESRRGIADEL
jgi:hypothetical protein